MMEVPSMRTITIDPPAQVAAVDRLRVKQAAVEAACSPGMIYVGIKEGCFKSWVVRRRGYERGIRYIDAKSFREWLNSQREEVTE
jgi:hypothetical protein